MQKVYVCFQACCQLAGQAELLGFQNSLTQMRVIDRKYLEFIWSLFFPTQFAKEFLQKVVLHIFQMTFPELFRRQVLPMKSFSANKFFQDIRSKNLLNVGTK